MPPRLRGEKGSEHGWIQMIFVRARLQPCRNRREIAAALAAEGMGFDFSQRLFSLAVEIRAEKVFAIRVKS